MNKYICPLCGNNKISVFSNMENTVICNVCNFVCEIEIFNQLSIQKQVYDIAMEWSENMNRYRMLKKQKSPDEYILKKVNTKLKDGASNLIDLCTLY